MNIITLERQETLTVTMTMTLTFSVWKSVDSGPVPNRRSIKPSGIINTFFPLRDQNRVPGILFLGWTPFWLAANQEYPQVVYFWSQPQLYQDTYTLHPETVCNKTDQLIDKVKHSHWIIQLKIQKVCPNFVDIPPKQSQSWLSCDQLISSRAPPQLFAGNMNRANIWVCRSRNKYEDISFGAMFLLLSHN